MHNSAEHAGHGSAAHVRRTFGSAGWVVLFAIALNALAAAAVAAQSTDAGTLYKQAVRREALLRQELETVRSGAPGGALLERIRVLVESYEDLARLFASSEYRDDSLAQGGALAADAFAQFGEATDRATALRLLTTLSKQFPNSHLNRQASARVKTLEQARPLAGVKLQEETVRVAPLPAPKAAPRVKGPEESTPLPTASAPVQTASAPVQTPPVPAPTAAAAPRSTMVTGPVTLRAIRRDVLPEALRITLELDREVPYYDERIEGPPRVFVDLPNTRAADTLKDATIPYPDGAVRQVRVGRQLDSRTRVVLDLNGAGSHRVYTQYDPYRVVIDFERTVDSKAARPIANSATPAPALLASKVVALSRTPTRAPAVLAATVSRSVRTAAPTAVPGATASAGRATDIPAATATSAAPATPRQNAGGGFSLARQLGLSVARIVIDPGHGGHDPGARVNGVSEASLVLDVATRLEELLRKEQGVEVVLTRRSDTFVALEERTAIANRSGADLFLSIHANASTAAAARGVETYFLNFATNPEAEAIAARENAGSAKTMRHLPDIVQAITLNSKIDESRDLATIIQSTLYDRLRKTNRSLKNLGVKQAPFVVLVGATMPSALAEISFMTNRSEAALLKTEKYRQQIAEALFAGITRYQGSVKKVIARSE